MTVRDRTVIIGGATNTSGLTVARTLIDAGARVIATGRSPERLAALADAGAETIVSDATSYDDMTRLAHHIGPIDGVIPLVGGWRGGDGLAGQSDDDFRMLLPALHAVRATSRAFDTALKTSPAGRFAIVSSTAVTRPLAGNANYATIKAASETWTHAVAQGYTQHARDNNEPLRTAAIVFRVAGALSPQTLAEAVIELWNNDAAKLNNTIIELG